MDPNKVVSFAGQDLRQIRTPYAEVNAKGCACYFLQSLWGQGVCLVQFRALAEQSLPLLSRTVQLLDFSVFEKPDRKVLVIRIIVASGKLQTALTEISLLELSSKIYNYYNQALSFV